jgi:hypothetical protein
MILNKTIDCYDGRVATLHYSRIRYIVIHRISLAFKTDANPHPIPDDQLGAVGLAMAFKDRGLCTGGRPPYHILICMDGAAEQILPLSVQGVHARRYNDESIAIAMAGNTDMREAPLAQHKTLVEVCKPIYKLNGGLQIAGHTDLPGASGDPRKRCPGRFLPLEPIIQKVCLDPFQELERAGFVL